MALCPLSCPAGKPGQAPGAPQPVRKQGKEKPREFGTNGEGSWEDPCCEAPRGSLLFQPRWGTLCGRSCQAEAWRFQRIPRLIYLAELELLWKGIGRMLFPPSSCRDFGWRRCLCRREAVGVGFHHEGIFSLFSTSQSHCVLLKPPCSCLYLLRCRPCL